MGKTRPRGLDHRAAVAVIGIACRLPGADDPQRLWQLLRDGRDATTDTPAPRWAMHGLSGPDEAPAGLRRGGFLEHVDRFDAAFFGVSPREAAAMDPQQRLVLELSWEALEDAGLVPDALATGPTGVYIGALAADYAELLRDPDAVARQAFTGTQRSIIANRVSYSLRLRGPSMTVDTGQSSSLVAVHLACQSLRCGESALALAGGVQLNLGLQRALALSGLGALSPDGRCFTFDARANGFVRGEGGAVVVLKPLERALADGDRTYCVIAGSAVNNDGGGDGLTAPDQQAQELVLRSAYADAGIAPADVEYVELHGTGTPLGDRVEAAALGAVLGACRAAGRPLAVGSVKTNVGHLEAAAGVVGLLKAALSLERRAIPASLNFERANPEIPLDQLGLRVQTSSGPWPDPDRAVAGVSSFGLGGTNCHVVLEAPPAPRGRGETGGGPPSAVPWLLSGRTAAALRDNAARLLEHARGTEPDGDPPIEDVGYSLATGRSRFAPRAVVIGGRRAELLDGLRGLVDDQPGSATIVGEADSELCADRPVFVFPGQGGQWARMGAALLERCTVFAERMTACSEALSDHVEFSLEGVLRGDPGQPSLDRTEVVQPVLFSIMVSLSAVWDSFGVAPAAVIGHSQGEIAAAHVAGGLSLQDAARIVAVRSRAIAQLSGRGGMLSVSLSPDELRERIAGRGDTVVVAAVNGPAELVASGDRDALVALARECEADGVRAKLLAVDYASHSPHVESLRERLLDELGPVRPRSSEIPLYSTTTGELIDTARMDAEHWYRNLRQTVRFATAVRALIEDGRRTFIEVSPHPVLAVAVESTAEQLLGDRDRVLALATLRRDHGGLERILTSLAELYVRGGAVDWQAAFDPLAARRVRLPGYAFQRRSHWVHAPAPATAARPSSTEPLPKTEPATAADLEPAERSSFAARVGAMPAGDRARAVLDGVLGQAAAVLGHASAGEVDARLSFRELGFDSPATVQLRNRINRLTGLRLASTVMFDNPTPAALAERVLSELVDAPTGDDQREPRPERARADEPIAIVGMACRYPGGVRSPEDLWQLVAT
ncbi:MAG: type I polyketide synthase, partial [Solirubrobacteraceae bacterium]